jgi:FkbM family methyltransferase
MILMRKTGLNELDYNWINRNFKTKNMTKFDDFSSKIKTFLHVLFYLKDLDKVGKLKILRNNLPQKQKAILEDKKSGFKFCVDRNGGLGIISITYFEPEVYRFMLLVRGDIFIDIGANVGGYSILNSPRFKKIIAVEPGTKQLELLNKNIKLNNIGNIDVMSCAIAEEAGIKKLYKTKDLVNYSIAHKGKEYEEITAITLDKLLDDYSQVELLKIDVEGAELEVIKSGLSKINRVHFIVFEIRNLFLDEILKMLDEKKFDSFVLEDRIGNEEKNILFINRNYASNKPV